MPTLISYNIYDNTFILTIQCPYNIPLFKLIVKNIIQELGDKSTIRQSTNLVKKLIPGYLKQVDPLTAELDLNNLIFNQMKPNITIFFSKSEDKIDAFK